MVPEREDREERGEWRYKHSTWMDVKLRKGVAWG